MKKSVVFLVSIFLGIIIGFTLLFFINSKQEILSLLSQRQTIGFLPYWLVSKEQTHFEKYITTLSYFGLALDADGSIKKLNSPQEEEPGWYMLRSGKVNSFLQTAKKNNIKTSLVIFSGNIDTINSVIASPSANAKHLISSAMPIMQKYGFTDLNLDIEYTQNTSDTARMRFAQFIGEVKKVLSTNNKTLTLEMSTNDVIHKSLIDPKLIKNFVDYIVLMAYDYHSTASLVTGAIAPLYGAGDSLEYDVSTATHKLIENIPPYKIILGMPLYGYEWETISPNPRSAIIPSTGVTASNQRVENLLNSCATCSAQFDNQTQESYLIFKDAETQTYHQIFYPDIKSAQAKIKFANSLHLGGIGLWALGYENEKMLTPFASYKGVLNLF
ncbi:MAG TPA: glycoside hydrolase family 18 protein [Patescibacteria group bacterium]